jgi:PIN domain nuclease of toxin-antitoxin system
MWWLLAESRRLRPDTRALLTAPDARLHYSPLSFLELAIKRAKGKFAFDDRVLFEGVESLAIIEIPVRRSTPCGPDLFSLTIATRSTASSSPRRWSTGCC